MRQWKTIICLLSVFAMAAAIYFFYGQKEKSQFDKYEDLLIEYPDSVVRELENYAPAISNQEQTARYGLLLTHARYKSFIEEYDDSLISQSAQYFIEHKQAREASLALFLQGNILRNRGEFGSAVVAQLRGLELAAKANLPMEEGLCARGLYKVYEELCDGSLQIHYAEIAKDAFARTGKNEWVDYASYDLASAYSNAGEYDRALKELYSLTKSSDTVLRADTERLLGLIYFAKGDDRQAINHYTMAQQLSPTILTEYDCHNLLLAQSNMGIEIKDTKELPHELLAIKGEFKNAYENLTKYSATQDSVLRILLRDNVGASVAAHQKYEELLRQEKIRNERLIWLAVLCLFVLVLVTLLWRLQSYKEQQRRLIQNADFLGAELLLSKDTATASLRQLFEDKYAQINALCSVYYENNGTPTEKKRIIAEVERIIFDLSKDSQRIEEIERNADICHSNICSGFRQDFPSLKHGDHLIFLYIVIGLSARSIALLLDEKIDVVYNRKSRLKSKIKNSNARRRDEYLSFFI